METTKISEMFRAYMPDHTIVRCAANRICVTDTVVGREAVYDPVRRIIMDTGVRSDVTMMMRVIEKSLM